MSKRSFPFEEDTFARQTKHHVTERINASSEEKMREVYERTHALLFEGARRAAEGEPGASNQTMSRACENEGENMDTEDWDPYSIRHSRHEMLKNMEKREPSPVPSSQHLLTSFMNTTRRTHGALTQAETERLMFEAKNYRQLNIDSFMRPGTTEDVNQNIEKEDKDDKDEMEL